MALQKQELSIDLIRGGDTKTNSHIDKDFMDMENVVFTGDLTAKKMNGFDNLASLPASEVPVLIASRAQDLIAQSTQGTYRWISSTGRLEKISSTGSASVSSMAFSGYVFAISDNFICTLGFNLDSTENLYIASFFSKNMEFINEIRLPLSGPATLTQATGQFQIIPIGDSFVLVRQSHPFVDSQSFSINTASGLFEVVPRGQTGGISFNYGAVANLKAFDFFQDGGFSYGVVSTDLTSTIISSDMITLAIPSPVMMISPVVEQITTTAQVFNRDSETFFLMYGASGGRYFIDIVRKDTLVTTSHTLFKIGIPTSSLEFVVFYPLSDTDGIAVTETFYPGSLISSMRPLGKIVKIKEILYMPVFLNSGSSVCSCLVRLSKSGSLDVANPVSVSDCGQFNLFAVSSFSSALQVMTVPNTQAVGEDLFFSTFSTDFSFRLTKVSFGPNASTTAIDVEGGLLIGSSMLSYYDGKTFSEHGFIGAPLIVGFNLIAQTGGALPADSGYQVVALFSWVDALGNVFYSEPSVIKNVTTPSGSSSIPAGSKLVFSVIPVILTLKNRRDIQLNFYIRRKNNIFQKANVLPFPINLANVQDIIQITLDSYPPQDAEVYPYADGSIQQQTSGNSLSMSLYADRIIRISRDNPSSVSYSQSKLDRLGFEFNDSFFFLNVLDKQGIGEDRLSGTMSMDGRLIIFKKSSILFINGTGPSRANTQDDFSEPQLLTSDVGAVSQRSIVLVPDGIMFKSEKGIYLLNRSLQVSYIGAAVEKFNSENVTSAVVVETENEVRFSTDSGHVLVYNYFSSAWSWFLNINFSSAGFWKRSYVGLTSSGSIMVESNQHKKLAGAKIVQKISTPWVRLKGIQSWQRVYSLLIIGRWKSAHTLVVRAYYDYEEYFSNEYKISPPLTKSYNTIKKPQVESIESGDAINGVYQFKIDLIRKTCQAVRFEIIDNPLDVENNSGEGFALSNLTITLGSKKGVAKIQSKKSF